MKKDRSKEMDEKYWEGISSLQEERSLKHTSEKPYFEQLDELAKSEMKWDFDDFLELNERHDKPELAHSPKKLVGWRMWSISSAAAVALVAGFLFLKSKEEQEEVFQTPMFSSVPLAPGVLKEVPNVEERQLSYAATKKVNPTHSKQQVTTPRQDIGESIDDPVSLDQEAYVVVNGKPIYDDQEAERIVLASLKIMTTNFQEGRNALEKVKYMQVEL